VYACICHAVTEHEVRACAGQRLGEVVATTRAGSGCGSCVRRLRDILEQAPESLDRESAKQAA
jgi:bacterioferritin-associated ferredoxin